MINDVLIKTSLPLYIKNHAKGSVLVYANDNKLILKQRATFYIRKLASLYFIDLVKYKRFIRDYLNIKYKVPLVISNNTIFFQIHEERNFDHIWVNYCKILYVLDYKKEIEIFFKDNSSIKVLISIVSYNKIVDKITLILNYLKCNKHVIFNENFL